MSTEDLSHSAMNSPDDSGGHLQDYRLDAVVVRSNAATVFCATDLRNGRQVAIKIPHPNLESDPTLVDWFRRERQIRERLDHPAIPRMIQKHGCPDAWLIMEWFEGTPLSGILEKEKRLAPERAVPIVIAIGNALEYLHTRDLVHGDLRPENVMIGAGDQVKLLDFGGVAKIGARRLTITRIAQLTGGSDYIAPEELLGKRGDARSDIYALGMMLYVMLTGAKPFPGSDPAERLLAYPVPPRELEPAISPQLQEVVYRAMEREPRNRYASAREFTWDLEHLDQVGVAERPELLDWRRRQSFQARKVLLYIALALVPIAIFGLLLYLAKK